MILPSNHKHYVSIEKILNEGISYSTESNYWYGKGGKLKPKITEKLKPSNTPSWLDFKKAIGVELVQQDSSYFKFPLFTDKILIFNKEYSEQIFDQVFYEDNKYTFEEALDFDTGQSIEHWILHYWRSMTTLEAYLLTKPYQKPEVLIFESVPKDIIQVCEE
ncbi:DNA polymerase III [Paenibacillus sp. GSMTC-2017]|uniref:DNA polymerase III n=1 Tax=Paenibacillus sp. GSMTC-2017 TaxID=2794350 RepID=UPI002FBD36AC